MNVQQESPLVRCLRCDGCGELFVGPTGKREPWHHMSRDARRRVADCRQTCDACGGSGSAPATGNPAIDHRSMLDFLHTVLLNLLGTMPYGGMSDEQREKHKAAYETAWALWQYYHADAKPDPFIWQALEESVTYGRRDLGWDEEDAGPGDSDLVEENASDLALCPSCGAIGAVEAPADAYVATLICDNCSTVFEVRRPEGAVDA